MPLEVAGIGVHSGASCRVALHRAEGPLRFSRGGAIIPADLAHVVGADRATSLGRAGHAVHMVEHLLAALRIGGFYSGVLIEASADELPILDGSAAPWAEAVAALGDPPPPPPPLVVREPLSVAARSGTAHALVGDEHLRYEIDFDHPAIGQQAWEGGPGNYAELSDARTFGFLSDYEALKARGLALGAAEGHVIVFSMDGPSRPLRNATEPVRHKALDALGDLMLLGRPVRGRLHVERGSHALHHAFARALALHASPAAAEEP